MERGNKPLPCHASPVYFPQAGDIASCWTQHRGKVRANAYDMVINGTEVGGGSIRIHDRPTQQLMFTHLGFTEEEAKKTIRVPHGGL